MTSDFIEQTARLPERMQTLSPTEIQGTSAAAGRAEPRSGWTDHVRGFRALAVTQFLGAFNDHFFKIIVSLIAIDSGLRTGSGSAYLSLSGVVLVLPYLIFSGYAGYLADRFDKRIVLIFAKVVEVLFAVLAVVALVFQSVELLITTLFLLAAQSTFFSPGKYGILPEILPEAQLSRGNGVLELGRYFAIIGGTAVGGVLLALWSDQPAALGMVIVVVAAAGCLTSLGIPSVPPSGTPRRRVLNPWGEIASGIKRVASAPQLWPVVAGTTCFDFICTLMMMDVLLLAKGVMGLDDLGCGILAALAGIGIGVGSFTAGRLSGRRAELAFVPLGATGTGVMLVLLANGGGSFAVTAAALAAIGLFGGFIIVPLFTALQQRSLGTERGKVIATNNFVNMTAVLAASVSLWVLRDGLGISPERILALCGVFMLTVATVVLWRSPRIRTRLSLLAAVAVTGFVRSMGVYPSTDLRVLNMFDQEI